MDLRRARPEDHAATGEVTVAAYRDFTLPGADFYVDLLRDAARRDREAELWVATQDGEVVGTVTLCPPGSPWREIGTEAEAEFRMLAVAPSAQGRGIGLELTRLVERRAVEDGFAAIVLSSLAAMHTAHRIYVGLGYERVPARDWSPTPDVDLIAFRKEL